MPIEKVFAIRAPASDVYAALQRDLASASEYEGETHEVIARERDRSVALHVRLGGIPCYLTYTLEERAGQTEVMASLVPHSWRWTLFNVATLGLRRSNFELLLAQGLANLKAEVEGGDDAGADDGGVEAEEDEAAAAKRGR